MIQSLALLWVLFAQGETAQPRESSVALLRAAGISVEPKSEQQPEGGSLHAGCIGSIEWRGDATTSIAVRFMDPTDSQLYSSDVQLLHGIGSSEAKRGRAPLRSVPIADKIVLTQLGREPLKQGVMQASVDFGRGSPERVTLESLMIDCAMSSDATFPLEIGVTAKSIRLEWDLHSVLDPNHSYVVPVAAQWGELPSIPIEVELEFPPVVATPSEVSISPGTNQVIVAMESNLGALRIASIESPASLRPIELLRHSECVQELVCEVTSYLGHRQAHPYLTIEMYLGADEQPYYRNVPVRPIGPVIDLDGLPTLSAVLAPGEPILLVDGSNGFPSLLYPARFHSTSESDVSRGLRFQPDPDSKEGNVVLLGANGPVRLRYRTSHELGELIMTWGSR